MNTVCFEIVGALSSAMRSQDVDASKSFRKMFFEEAMERICGLDDDILKGQYLDIYQAVRIHCAWVDSVDLSEVGGTQVRFRQMLSTLLPGASIALAPPVRDRKFPDSWVLFEGNLMPVEVKRKDFDAAALTQLLNYMAVYGTQRGIAAAPRLTVELPASILFICVN